MGTWKIEGDTSYISGPTTGEGTSFNVSFNPNTGESATGVAQIFTITYNDNGNVTSTQYTLPYCYVPAPEPEVEYTFNVDFDRLNQGFTYDEDCNYTAYTVTVTSKTRTNSSSPWSWVAVNGSFVGQLNGATLNFHDDGQQGQDPTVHKCTVSINGCPNNEAVSNLKLTITQPREGTSSVSSSMTFNFSAEETPTYYNEIRPYILECTYQMGEKKGGSDYYLHFKSYEGVNGISVNKKIIFFANPDNYFSTKVNGSNCAGESAQKPQDIGNEPYMKAGEKDTFNCSPTDDCLSIALSRGLFLRFVSQECKGQRNFKDNFYLYNDSYGLGTKIDFKNENGDKFLGCKDGPCPKDSYNDGERGVYLKIPDKIDFVTGPDISKTSNVIFTAPNGQTTLSVYENGAVFVDDAPEGVATVNERFQDITQFVQQVYPNDSYTSIDACGLFNGIDLGEHCINDIVIENGELIRRDESIPSPTIAMHIELDETPSSTQAMHIEEENN